MFTCLVGFVDEAYRVPVSEQGLIEIQRMSCIVLDAPGSISFVKYRDTVILNSLDKRKLEYAGKGFGILPGVSPE